jgi:eukaryotic-like serine/threonine-protein kinase
MKWPSRHHREMSNVDGGAPTAAATSAPVGAVALRAIQTSAELPEPGYDVGAVIGRGGMGEVVTARDRRIGRDVAIKRMLGTSADARQRFLREAQVQARLDHTSVPPVYEIGIGADGQPFFTMKQLAGVTFAQRMRERAPLQRLLRAFADVCLAVGYAHERGVVHRDLKPANIMLGDYGEVYVLDWGIARVLVEPDPDAGTLLGTPGYMAPEQCKGEEATPASDVYALGSILFEILSGEPLHPPGVAAILSTVSDPTASPAARTTSRDVPPELDRICLDALAADPTARPSARSLGDQIERYLDGDRDLERRRAVAARELEAAKAALTSDDPEQRAVAMQRAGRALALDPDSTEAAALITTLLVEPPRRLPQRLVAELADEETEDLRLSVRQSMWTMVGLLSLLVIVPWTEIRNWTTLGIAVAVMVAMTARLWLASRATPHRRLGAVQVLLVTTPVVFALTRVIGSYILTPAIITGCLFAMTANPWLRAHRSAVYVWLVFAVLAPVVLEQTGVFESTLAAVGGSLIVTSPILRSNGLVGEIALASANLLLLASLARFALVSNRKIFEARNELRIHAWHLRQLLPERSTRP